MGIPKQVRNNSTINFGCCLAAFKVGFH